MAKKIQSIEPKIADLINTELRGYGLTYYLEQDTINTEIEKALQRAPSKSGGAGKNRVDCKLLLQDDKLNYYPIIIEYKGYKDKLEKLNKDKEIDNVKADGTPNYQNIAEYAVNGAIHYANALLQYTSYTDVIAIGVTGYEDTSGKTHIQIGVYYVGKSNYGLGKKVNQYTDLSFLKPENFSQFISEVHRLHLTDEELLRIHQKREERIEDAFTKINERIYKKEEKLSALSRIHLVAASIIANLGIPNKVTPLEVENLLSSSEENNTDGHIIIRKITTFLKEKNIPDKKQQQIISSFSISLLDEALNRPRNGISLLKEIFTEVVEDLGYFYKVGLDTDFTGKLFNIMFRWLSFANDEQNDVVLTPRYVAYLMAKLARVQQNTYVWDFATGSAGLLVAAMNLMLQDAKNNIHSPEKLREKEQHIKTRQILGIEVLPEIYMLAILNMLLMGDGSGNYSFGNPNEPFPADAFLLNPPYSAEGKGMIFVERALSMMNKGYAVVIIQDSAGSGKAKEFNQRILQRNTLEASIKMPTDLFKGKSNVHTCIYVFKVGEKHEAKYRVKFIDLRNDGYKRADRKKAKASSNLQDIDHAIERYEEIANLVKFGSGELHYFTTQEYVEDTIALEGKDFGADWNFDQHKKIDTLPTFVDFKKTVADYLAWEVSNLLKKQNITEQSLGK